MGDFYGLAGTLFTTDAIVFAQNIVWAFAAFITALIFAWRCYASYLKKPINWDVFLLSGGVSLEAISIALHREHWAGWRLARALELDPETIQSYVDSPMPSIYVFMCVCGAIMVTAPVSRIFLGKWWWFVSALISGGVWLGAVAFLRLVSVA